MNENRKLKDAVDILMNIFDSEVGFEVELEDDILISYYADNPLVLEVREGIDGSVTEYKYEEINDLVSKYGELVIEDIR